MELQLPAAEAQLEHWSQNVSMLMLFSHVALPGVSATEAIRARAGEARQDQLMV